MSILCIGEALIDMICTDKGLPLSEGEHFLKKPGGAPTNVATAIAAIRRARIGERGAYWTSGTMRRRFEGPQTGAQNAEQMHPRGKRRPLASGHSGDAENAPNLP